MRHDLAWVILSAFALAGCEDSATRGTKARIVGTWVAEVQEHGGMAQRVLTLDANGHVKDSVRLMAPSGAASLQQREGEWFFDGVNFKRKYTIVDGKPLTNAHFIYETYELKSVTDAELVGRSNVGSGEIRYRRMASGGAR